jgi:hypothetical protein
MTFETADDVLEHFGVKGMKWGVRQRRSSERTRGQKIRRRVGIAAVVTGAAFAATVLSSRGSTPISSAASMPFQAAGRGWTMRASDAATFNGLARALVDAGR